MAQERAELRIVGDQIGSPTSSECIAQATADILAQLLAPNSRGLNGRSGIYNLTSTGETSWFGFAEALLTKSSSNFGFTVPNLIPIKTSEFPRPAQRPANSRLSCERLEQTFGVALPHWEDALSLVLDTLTEGSSRVTPKA
jgi:dTDP-4-dehydrorhamnose reductase